jgi:hypothetical protein
MAAAEMQGSPPAEAVLRALERFSKELSEVRGARSRPHSRFSIGAEEPPLTKFPHLSTCLDLPKLWALSIDANLALGKTGEALEDLRDGLRLHVALKEQPALISILVRVAALVELQRAIERGLLERRWKPLDLEVVDHALATIDLAGELRFALASERGFVNDAAAWMRRLPFKDRVRRIEEFDIFHSEPRGWKLWVSVLDRAKDYREQLRENQMIDQRLAQLGGSLDGLWPRLSDGDVWTDETEGVLGDITRTLVQRVIVAETALRQTRASCALERHRLTEAATLPHSMFWCPRSSPPFRMTASTGSRCVTG